MKKGKEENARVEDMKDSIGDETFSMINDQLSGMGRKVGHHDVAHTSHVAQAAVTSASCMSCVSMFSHIPR